MIMMTSRKFSPLRAKDENDDSEKVQSTQTELKTLVMSVKKFSLLSDS